MHECWKRVFFTATGLAFLFLGTVKQGVALTLVDQDEDTVVAHTFQDRNPKDGKPDGDLVVATLFRIEKEKIRKAYIFQLEEFLTSEESNLKHQLKPGDLFTIYNNDMNPHIKVLENATGKVFVAFLRPYKGNVYTLMSMKIAPVETESTVSGEVTKRIRNPWAPKTGTSPTAQRVAPGSWESMRDFSDRITQKAKRGGR